MSSGSTATLGLGPSHRPSKLPEHAQSWESFGRRSHWPLRFWQVCAKHRRASEWQIIACRRGGCHNRACCWGRYLAGLGHASLQPLRDPNDGPSQVFNNSLYVFGGYNGSIVPRHCSGWRFGERAFRAGALNFQVQLAGHSHALSVSAARLPAIGISAPQLP